MPAEQLRGLLLILRGVVVDRRLEPRLPRVVVDLLQHLLAAGVALRPRAVRADPAVDLADDQLLGCRRLLPGRVADDGDVRRRPLRLGLRDPLAVPDRLLRAGVAA
jgi:hypothetical protein